MASTYVNNLRVAEPADGDSGWGTSTNTSLELIGEALGIGTEAIVTNADTHTSTVVNETSSPARAFRIKYTGTLDSDCTITIEPNTMKRVQIIENATSGGFSIIISQGSGANVTIASSSSKVVYLDGAGSGAAVVDALPDAIDTDQIADDAVTADKLANAINTSIAANTAKVTNATHTGDVTGATALTIAVDAVDIAMLSATGIASSSTFLRGDNAWEAAGGAYNDWAVKTTTYTASSKDQLICNHASTPFTVTLPGSPSAGDTVILKNVGAALVTVGRNSEDIDSVAEDGTLPEGNAVQLVYVDADIGWASL